MTATTKGPVTSAIQQIWLSFFQSVQDYNGRKRSQKSKPEPEVLIKRLSEAQIARLLHPKKKRSSMKYKRIITNQEDSDDLPDFSSPEDSESEKENDRKVPNADNSLEVFSKNSLSNFHSEKVNEIKHIVDSSIQPPHKEPKKLRDIMRVKEHIFFGNIYPNEKIFQSSKTTSNEEECYEPSLKKFKVNNSDYKPSPKSINREQSVSSAIQNVGLNITKGTNTMVSISTEISKSIKISSVADKGTMTVLIAKSAVDIGVNTDNAMQPKCDHNLDDSSLLLHMKLNDVLFPKDDPIAKSSLKLNSDKEAHNVVAYIKSVIGKLDLHKKAAGEEFNAMKDKYDTKMKEIESSLEQLYNLRIELLKGIENWIVDPVGSLQDVQLKVADFFEPAFQNVQFSQSSGELLNYGSESEVICADKKIIRDPTVTSELTVFQNLGSCVKQVTNNNLNAAINSPLTMMNIRNPGPQNSATHTIKQLTNNNLNPAINSSPTRMSIRNPGPQNSVIHTIKQVTNNNLNAAINSSPTMMSIRNAGPQNSFPHSIKQVTNNNLNAAINSPPTLMNIRNPGPQNSTTHTIKHFANNNLNATASRSANITSNIRKPGPQISATHNTLKYILSPTCSSPFTVMSTYGSPTTVMSTNGSTTTVMSTNYSPTTAVPRPSVLQRQVTISTINKNFGSSFSSTQNVTKPLEKTGQSNVLLEYFSTSQASPNCPSSQSNFQNKGPVSINIQRKSQEAPMSTPISSSIGNQNPFFHNTAALQSSNIICSNSLPSFQKSTQIHHCPPLASVSEGTTQPRQPRISVQPLEKLQSLPTQHPQYSKTPLFSPVHSSIQGIPSQAGTWNATSNQMLAHHMQFQTSSSNTPRYAIQMQPMASPSANFSPSIQHGMSTSFNMPQFTKNFPQHLLPSNVSSVQAGNLSSTGNSFDGSVPNTTSIFINQPSAQSVKAIATLAESPKNSQISTSSDDDVQEITTCFLCGKDSTITCCGSFVYCSSECKEEDFERHQQECVARRF